MNRVVQVCLLVAGAYGASYAGQMPADASAAPVVVAPVQADVTEWSLVQGVDTAGDEGRGDWFKKKKILQQARKVYQELHELVQKISEGHATMSKSYGAEIERLSNALTELGIVPTEVEQKLKDLDASIEKLAAQAKLTDDERKKLVEQQDTKNILQQFLVDTTFATELQQGLTQAVVIAAAQVQQCHIYEQKAWNLYESIDAALNDTIAEQMFEEMQTIFENVGIIGAYLVNDLNGYFQKSMPLLQEQETKVAEQYALLQNRGIFKKKLSAQEMQEEQKTAAAAQEAKSRSWWQLIFSPFVWLWNWIIGFFRK
jgi:hypothetical protein